MLIPVTKATNVSNFRMNLKNRLDLVVKEDMTLYVTRKNDENVVVMNEKVYQDMIKTINRLEFEAKIQMSLEQAREGKVKYVTHEELAEYE